MDMLLLTKKIKLIKSTLLRLKSPETPFNIYIFDKQIN